jgi:hypothetical protein
VVGDIERDAFGFLRDAGIARRALELIGERARRHFPGQRMLASAGTENKNVHMASARYLRGLAGGDWDDKGAGPFVDKQKG